MSPSTPDRKDTGSFKLNMLSSPRQHVFFSLVHSVFVTEVKFFSDRQKRFMTVKGQILPGRESVQGLLSFIPSAVALYFADTNIRPS